MEIRLLGPLEVVGEDGEVVLRAAKHRRLLAALAVRAGEAQSVDLLTEAVWGEAPPDSSRNLVQVYISQIRKVLPAPALVRTVGSGYVLELPSEALDSARFERLLAEGNDALRNGNPALASSLLRRALALWRGAALAEFAYEDFARAEAERLEELRLVAVGARVDADLDLARHAELVPELEALIAANPLRERLVAQLMTALYRAGRHSDALARYRKLRRRLRDELGLDPSEELRELQRRILQQDPALLSGSSAPPPASDRLPAAPNALLGRERELADLHNLLLRDRVRFVVMAGAGGSGKTRLALEAARQAAPSFANGAVFVALAALRDPGLVVHSIAQALEIQEKPGEDTLTALANALRSQELLLVVDNAEHVREGCAALVDLLAAAPRLTLLVTSRTVLHLSGEHVYPVDPLDEDAAVGLFVERAREAGATIEGQVSEVVHAICARLDGLPLAVELAARRTRALTPDELLGHLEERLPLLTGGPRDLPARQQTLRATQQWSFDLLDADEQRALTRLSVFAGGFTLEAAEAVAEATSDELSSLLNHSLLTRSSLREGSRFSMLETTREFAFDQLSGQRTQVERRHAKFFLGLAERADFRGAEQEQWLARLAAERDNLRVALIWSARADPELELRLASALVRFWWLRGEVPEGRRWLEDGLLRGAGRPEARARALVSIATLASHQGDLEAAVRFATDGLTAAEEVGDTASAVTAHTVLGAVAHGRHRSEAARWHDQQSAALAIEANLEEEVHIAKLNLAVVELDDGQFDTAQPLLEEVLAYYREKGSTIQAGVALLNLGEIAQYLGRPEEARARFRAALETFERIGFDQMSARALQGLALVEATSSSPREAARLLGIADRLLAEIGVPGSWDLVIQMESDVRDQIGDVEYAAAYAEGRGAASET